MKAFQDLTKTQTRLIKKRYQNGMTDFNDENLQSLSRKIQGLDQYKSNQLNHENLTLLAPETGNLVLKERSIISRAQSVTPKQNINVDLILSKGKKEQVYRQKARKIKQKINDSLPPHLQVKKENQKATYDAIKQRLSKTLNNFNKIENLKEVNVQDAQTKEDQIFDQLKKETDIQAKEAPDIGDIQEQIPDENLLNTLNKFQEIRDQPQEFEQETIKDDNKSQISRATGISKQSRRSMSQMTSVSQQNQKQLFDSYMESLIQNNLKYFEHLNGQCICATSTNYKCQYGKMQWKYGPWSYLSAAELKNRQTIKNQKKSGSDATSEIPPIRNEFYENQANDDRISYVFDTTKNNDFKSYQGQVKQQPCDFTQKVFKSYVPNSTSYNIFVSFRKYLKILNKSLQFQLIDIFIVYPINVGRSYYTN